MSADVRHAAQHVETWVAYWGGPQAARKAWKELRTQLVYRGGFTRPVLFWAYAPGVPAALRHTLDRPDPRPQLYGVPPTPEESAQSAAADKQRDDRRRFLVARGEITERERPSTDRRNAQEDTTTKDGIE